MTTLSAIALNCSLKSAGEGSSTQRMLNEALSALARQGVGRGEIVRVVDRRIRPGVTSNEGEGDEWPALRRAILDSNILVLGTPIWLGHPSSVCQRVLERLDAFLGEMDEQGRMVSYGRVAVVCVVGNEDGAHHVTAELYQALGDVGFSIPANGAAYWVGEAMGKQDFKDLPEVPEKVAGTLNTLARNAAHLARLLAENPYPGTGAETGTG